MFDVLVRTLEKEPAVACALVFGSRARGDARPDSDLDLAVSLTRRFSALELGGLSSRLESATGSTVDLCILDEAPPALSYRVFRDGRVVCDRDHDRFVELKARAIVEYLDFKPIEDICARGVLEAAKRRG